MQPTQPLSRSLRRLALTTKQAGKDYYKGTRTGSMGWHTKYGGYRIDWTKVRTYRVPDMTDFKLTPFVYKGVKVQSTAPMTGQRYIEAWKRENGIH